MLAVLFMDTKGIKVHPLPHKHILDSSSKFKAFADDIKLWYLRKLQLFFSARVENIVAKGAIARYE